jgi:spore germination cell wall hydrolase CwlJ-like protein/DNA invertase Pin-like site-specific DNA recombinase
MRSFEFITEAGGNPPFSPTPEQQQDIADLYASGFSGADIAKEYKVGQPTISKFLRNLPNFKELRQQFYKAREEQGLHTGTKGTTTDQIQRMANNFALGKNFEQLSKEFGISSNNILKMLRKLSNYEELKQQNTKARKDQGLLSIEDFRNKGITSAQVDQMAKEYVKGETLENVGKMFNVNSSNVLAHLTKRPDWEEIKFQNRTNRSRKLGGTQSLTNRGINKPGSKGIHAIRRTGSPSGSVFEDALEEDWKKTLGAIGVAGALAAGGQKTMQPITPPEVRPAVASTVAPAENPDVNILAQTMWGEARSHGANGMLAVGNVIKNRAEANMKMFGQGIRGVALKPKQFSCWNAGDPNRDRIKEILEYDRLISLRQSPDGTPFDEWFAKFKNSGNYMDYKAWLLAKDIAKKIISDRAPDPTNGAVYYHTTDVNPSWNANLDHVATVGNHVFYTLSENLSEYKVDNVEGLGSVPYNQNVDYFGLRVMMKPSTFLSLALPLNEPRSVEYIMQHMKNGGALGAPFLYVKIPADWEEGDLMRPASISGHEGRNRMLAIQKLEGDDPVEVHLLLQGGMRARHLNPGMIKELQNGMMNQSRNRYVTGPLFSK